MDEEEHAECVHCADEHPVGVLEAGYCPACLDDADSDETCVECGAHLDGDHELGCGRWDTF